jgi:hypothetical protein
MGTVTATIGRWRTIGAADTTAFAVATLSEAASPTCCTVASTGVAGASCVGFGSDEVAGATIVRTTCVAWRTTGCAGGTAGEGMDGVGTTVAAAVASVAVVLATVWLASAVTGSVAAAATAAGSTAGAAAAGTAGRVATAGAASGVPGAAYADCTNAKTAAIHATDAKLRTRFLGTRGDPIPIMLHHMLSSCLRFLCKWDCLLRSIENIVIACAPRSRSAALFGYSTEGERSN